MAVRTITNPYIDMETTFQIIGKWKFQKRWTGKEIERDTKASRRKRLNVIRLMKNVIANEEVKVFFVGINGGGFEASPAHVLDKSFRISIKSNYVRLSGNLQGRYEAYFHHQQLKQILAGGAADTELEKRRVGRPELYDWPKIDAFIIDWLSDNGVPAVKSTLIADVREYCETEFGPNFKPSDGTLYPRLEIIFNDFINSEIITEIDHKY